MLDTLSDGSENNKSGCCFSTFSSIPFLQIQAIANKTLLGQCCCKLRGNNVRVRSPRGRHSSSQTNSRTSRKRECKNVINLEKMKLAYMYSLHECVVFKNGENIQCSKKKGEIHSVESLVFQCGVSQLFVLLVPLGKSSACVHSCQILVAVFECC